MNCVYWQTERDSIVKTVMELPAGYGTLEEIDLQKDKKLMLWVNATALVIMVVFAAAGHSLVPINSIYDTGDGVGGMLLRVGVMVVGMVAYIVLHELVHGVCIRHFSGHPASYGFTGMYAYAGSVAYFAKRDYFVIALAPIVVWGVVLAVITLLVPENWFWVVYMIQLTNLSGAGGDLYVVYHFFRLPTDILVKDTGVSMTVYAPVSH